MHQASEQAIAAAPARAMAPWCHVTCSPAQFPGAAQSNAEHVRRHEEVLDFACFDKKIIRANCETQPNFERKQI
jgi:hypothetical protein